MTVSTIAEVKVSRRRGRAVARYQRRARSLPPEQGAGQTTRSESRQPRAVNRVRGAQRAEGGRITNRGGGLQTKRLTEARALSS